MSTQKKQHVRKRSPRAEGGRQSSSDGTFGNLCQSALFGALFGILAAALLLFAVTAIGYATADPCSLTKVLGLSALYLSALVAGFAALRRQRSMALLCGSLSGLFLMLVFLLLSLLFSKQTEASFQGGISLLLRLLMLPAAAIGGFLGLPRKSVKHPHKR